MKLTSIAAAAALLYAATSAQAKTFLFPIPQSVEWTGHASHLTNGFSITTQGKVHKHVKDAAKRYAQLIRKEQWVPVQVAYGQYKSDVDINGKIQGLTVKVKDNDCKLDLGVDESYTLDVPASGGKATLEAATWVGALRGLETFSQLVVKTDQKLVAHSAKIEDKPSYVHRGLMLDTSRNYYPLKDLLRTIDAMSYNKLNVFHWHVTDSQSWPLQFKSHPELSDKAAYSQDEIYTAQDVKQLISYAESRGVRVILELDMPAHTATIGESHPDYIVCGDKFWADYAAEPPAGQLHPLKDEVFDLIKDIIKEGTSMFPDSVYHGGGDEIKASCWETNEDVQKYMKQHNVTANEIWFEWTNKLVDFIQSDTKKRPMLWEDPIRDGGRVSNDTIVQVWTAPPQNFTSLGHDVVISTSDYFYLDCGHGGWVGNDPRYYSPTQQSTPEDTFNYGGTGGSWCAPFKTWQRIYSFDLTYGIPDDSPGKVLGGECALWSEQSGPTVLDGRLWPRAGAAAEIYWSGNYDSDHKKRTLSDVLPRFSDWVFRLNARGIDAEPIQPKYCFKHPERCNLNDPAQES